MTLALFAALTSCADEEAGEPEAVTGEPQAVTSAPASASGGAPALTPGKIKPDDLQVDIGEVMRRVHFSFRREGRAFLGGDYAYRVSVADHGALTVSPRYPMIADRWTSDPAKPVPAPHIITGLPATFTTVSIGGQPAGGRTVLAEDGSLTRPAVAGVTERVRNGEAGVEQSWEVAQRPSGGDLLVRVQVEGPIYTGATDGGLHFVDPATTLGLRYGTATWIDADGRRTTVTPVWEEGEIALRVPAAVLDRSTYPAVLDPIIGSEFGTDTAVTGSAFSRQEQPAIASSGSEYLIVWRDMRDGDLDIWGARLSTAGAVLDPNGILISGAAGNQEAPVVAYCNASTGSLMTTYFVAWHDYRTGTAHIYGTRVSTGGVVTDAMGIDLSPGETTVEQFPSIEFNGTNLIAVWTDFRLATPDAQPNIYGTRVNSSLTIVDSGDKLMSTAGATTTAAGGAQRFPVAHYYGGLFIIAWEDSRTPATAPDLYLTRMSATFNVTDLNGQIISNASGNQSAMDMMCNGAGTVRCGFAWTDYTTPTAPDIQVRVYEPSTNTFFPSAAGTTIGATGAQDEATVSWDGTNFAAFFEDLRSSTVDDIYAGRFDTAGALVDGTGVAIITRADAQSSPDVIYSASQHVIVYQDNRSAATAEFDVYATRVTSLAAGGVVDPDGIRITSSSNTQQSPAVAFDGTNGLIVWQDSRIETSWDIYGTRVSQTGSVLDASGIAIATGTNSQTNPAVTYGGGNYFVVWQDETGGLLDIRGKRVSTGGAVLDATAINVATDSTYPEREPDVASDGTNYMAAFAGNSTNGISIQRVSSAGALSGSKVNVTTPCSGCAEPEIDLNPSIAWNGSHYLAAYVRNHTNALGQLQHQVGGARITNTGTLSTDNRTVLTTPPTTIEGSDVASNGTQWLVVYSRSTSTSPYDILGQLFASDGTLSTSATVNSQAGEQRNPTITYDGYQYAVGWMDNRNAPFSGWDVYATWVTTAVSPLDTTGVIVSATTGDDQHPSFAVADHARVLGVYERYDGTATSDRVKGRYVSWADPHGTVCVTGTTCTSGLCVDGVCCDTACGGGSTTDCQACSTAAGGTNTGACTNSASTYTCRGAAAGGCDIAENCTGSSPTCPTNIFQPTTVQCRAAVGGGCDVAEFCPGGSAMCPADMYSPSTTVCRMSTGTCDVQETCTGTSPTCPTDTTYAPSTTICRNSVSTCDATEFCTGSSNSCPGDSFAPTTTVCRMATVTCDATEFCPGTSTVCPPDLVAPATTVCRAAVAGGCDVAENCNGVNTTCPMDVFAPSTTVCRMSAGLCDPQETCTGSSVTCPTDMFHPSSTVCRSAVPGGCDVAENCTGTMAACPGDMFAPSTTVCRVSAGPCDPQETCTGIGAACPGNLFTPMGTECRASTDLCDPAEVCTGSSGPCPGDMLAPSTQVCRAAVSTCDAAESCTGTAAACPVDMFASPTVVCRTAAGLCDVPENCTGLSSVCPTNMVASTTVVCRGVMGTCDVPENCDGITTGCPADMFLPSSMVCRAVMGLCDSAENCTGSGANCPIDSFLPLTTPCRPSAGMCDLTENCTGAAAACPMDLFAPVTTVCRATTGACDPQETCTGSGVNCPMDTFLPDGTSCNDGDVCTTSDECGGGSCQPGVPALEVTPNPIAFPDTAIETTAMDITATVLNIGEATITVTNITSSDAVTFPETDPAPLGLAPDEPLDVTVDFAPTTASIFNETLTIQTDICPPLFVAITGEGIIPGATITPNPWDFGLVAIEPPFPTQDFTITNDGASSFNVTGITLDNQTDFGLINVPSLPQTVLGGGGTLQFTVEGHPTEPADEVKNGVITVTISGNTATVDVSETAVCSTCEPDAGPDAKIDSGTDGDADIDSSTPGGADASLEEELSYYACNCRTGGTDTGTPLAGGLLLLAAAALFLRRRR